MFRVIKRRTAHIGSYYDNTKKRKTHRTEWILYGVFVLGLALGAWCVRQNSALMQRMFTLFENYTSVQATQTAAVFFSNSILKQILLLLITYLIGLCAIGVPFLYAVPLGYGCGIGLVSAYLYTQYALKGIGYCALLLYPGYAVSVVSTICACSCGIKMSESILKKLLLDTSAESTSYKTYNMQYLLLAVIAILSALLSTVLFTVFFKYFQFS